MPLLFLLTIFPLELNAAAKNRDLPRVERAVRAEFDDVTHIRAEEAAREAARYVWVDTREAREFAVSHIPGAVRLDPDLKGKALETALSALPKDKPVIVYCSVGVRSSTIARRIQAISSTDVRNLEGGIFQWTIDGRPLVDANGTPTTKTHGYDRNWGGLLPDGKRRE